MSETMTAESELYARLTMLPMDGWCSTEKALKLAQCVQETRPSLAVEIGVYAGRSLIAIALAMKGINHGKIIGIDPWTKEASSDGWYEGNGEWWKKLDHAAIKAKCDESIDKAGVRPYVELIQATNKDALPGIVGLGKAIGLLSIDGNHSTEQSSFDVTSYVPLVSSGGHIFFEDANWETVQNALRLMMQTCKLKEIVGNCAVFVKI